MGRRRDKNSSLTLIPRLVDEHRLRLETNLLNLGFFAATNEVETLRKTEKEVTREGYTLSVAVEFRCVPELGLPAMADHSKFVAFLKIVDEDRATHGSGVNTIRFSCSRMVQKLGLPPSQGLFEEIARWGKRMTATTIATRQVVYLQPGKMVSHDCFHVFDRFGCTETRNLSDDGGEEDFEVELSVWFMENFAQGTLMLPTAM